MPRSSVTENWVVPRKQGLQFLALSFVLGMVVGMIAMMFLFGILFLA